MLSSAGLKRSSPKIIAVTSGKGGVGKTSITVNTGIALSQKGYKVCLFDADSNLANINILLGVTPEYTLQHVLSGEKSIHEIMLQKSGLHIVPGASGIADFVGMQPRAQKRLIKALETLENDFDYLFVDTSSGIDTTVLSFVESAHQSIVVITPEPTSLTDAFSLLRVLKRRGHSKKVNIVVNAVSTEQRSQKIFIRFADAVEKYLGYRPVFLGTVLKDDLLPSAVCLQRPVIQYRPTSASSNCFYRLADVIDKKIDVPVDQTLSSQWKDQVLKSESPDFSDQTEADVTRPKNVDEAEKQLSPNDHRKAVLAYIEDTTSSKDELMDMMTGFMDAYLGRFKSYPVNAAKVLNHALEANEIPVDQVKDLLRVLQLTYESNFNDSDKASAARYLCSLVNAYVAKYKEYPFDAISTLYQSLELAPLSESKMRELLTTLHLMYQVENYLSTDKNDHEQEALLCCVNDDVDDLEKLTALIQQRNLKNLEQKIKQEFGSREDRKKTATESIVVPVPVVEENKINIDHERRIEDSDQDDDYDSLLSSIRYASMTE
ncbi:MAG: MinD/ParA family protein [Gammaproteobacteria bacterium]|nr:MinD/ParA family protein [Gammaproteobacteria bacterium]